MIKQIFLFRKRPDMTLEEFKDYYENKHSQLHKRVGDGSPFMPKAKRYVRRYVQPEKNPVTGEVIDPGFDVMMEIWWENREDYDSTMATFGGGEKQAAILADEENLFATHSNPCFTVEEADSAVGIDS